MSISHSEFESGDWNADYEYEYEDEGETEWEFGQQGPYDETEEMELAAELLTITEEPQLDQFLGKLIKKAGRAVKKAVAGPVGRTLIGRLRQVAKRALPITAGAAGTAFGGPLGGTIGTALGSAAGRSFGLELEGLSPEDQEFEVARRYVRLAGEAARQAAGAPAGEPPQLVARRALEAAARMHAPGLIRPEGEAVATRSGRWVRRGRDIVLIGA